jgi:hypothetical protein
MRRAVLTLGAQRLKRVFGIDIGPARTAAGQAGH